MSGTSPLTLCGSLSLHPVPLGMRMHDAGYAALGLDYKYVPFALVEDELEDALRGMRALGIRGFGISMPFKILVMRHLDALDELARRIGAVNTIVNDEGKLTGYNTDAWGAARALEEVMTLEGKHALVVGAGGAARAVAHSLADRGMRLRLLNRTAERARDLAAEVSEYARAPVTFGALDEIDSLEGFDALVNASSAGMEEYGVESPVPAGVHRRETVVMDIVYKPIRTRLLADAEGAGAVTVHGGRMLLHQACGQFELYTGREAPLGAMNSALEAAVGP